MRGWTLDRLLFIRLSEDDAHADDPAGSPEAAPARAGMATEWTAPDLPI